MSLCKKNRSFCIDRFPCQAKNVQQIRNKAKCGVELADFEECVV